MLFVRATRARPLRTVTVTLRPRPRGIHHLLASSFLALQPSPDPPSLRLALLALVGLPVGLWAYKCLMLVLFQRKIICMGYLPPGARTEELGRDVQPPKGTVCEEVKIASERGVTVSALLVRGEPEGGRAAVSDEEVKTVVFYLQGNAGNPLMRLPLFARLLRVLSSPSPSPPVTPRTPALSPPQIAIVAPAPRSYWHSTPRTPTEHGLLADYAASLAWAARRFPRAGVVVYGHSLGGAVGVCLLGRLRDGEAEAEEREGERAWTGRIRGLILENAFADVPGMVRAVYAPRWVPYRYLGRFVLDRWDALGVARRVGARARARARAGVGKQEGGGGKQGEGEKGEGRTVLERVGKDALVLVSERDEVVPREMGEAICEALKGRLVVVRGALHEDAWTKKEWEGAMREYVLRVQDEYEKGTR